MKRSLLLFTALFFIFLSTSCEKAAQIHSLSAHTWVVINISNTPIFNPLILIGDELTFHDNRLIFINSNGTEIDGQWDFLDGKINPGSFIANNHNLKELSIASDLGTYEFTITELTATELELSSEDFSSFGTYRVSLKAKE